MIYFTMTSPERRPPVHPPNFRLFEGLYEEFGTDLAAAHTFIDENCQDPEMRKQFDTLEAEALYLMARHAQPETVVEISPCDGWSTIWLLRALEDNQHGNLISFDIHDRSTQFVPESLRSRWKLELGDVRKHPERLPEGIDLLLLDSKHTYGFARWYFDTVIPRANHGAPIVIHDIASGLPLPIQGRKIWTGLLAPFTEAWKVRRELRSRDVGYYTLSGVFSKENAPNASNSFLISMIRSQYGFGRVTDQAERNPSVFFFADQRTSSAVTTKRCV